MNNILIVAEQYHGKTASVSLELLGIARELAGVDGHVSAALCGYGINKQAEQLAGYGADTVYAADGGVFSRYNTECFSKAVYKAVKAADPDIVLFGATSVGRDLAPRLSAKLGTGLTADCTKLEIGEDGGLLMTRPAFGGNLFATIICPAHRPQMSTVRPGVMKMRAFDKDARVQIIPIDVSDIKTEFKLRVLAETPAEVKEKDIQEAKILISCGRGASDKNTLAAAGELAVLVDGSVSSSRALVDSNLMPHAKQVGQTGKTVRPTAYIAAGISGAVQHLAGMGEAEFIIAVNKDPNAPIFEASHLGVVSDATKVLPLLIEEIKKIKAEKNI